MVGDWTLSGSDWLAGCGAESHAEAVASPPGSPSGLRPTPSSACSSSWDGADFACREAGSGRPARPTLRAGAGGRAQAAVSAVAVRAGGRRAFGVRHFASVEGEQGALVVFNGARVLADIAGVVNSAGQFAEIALFDGFEGAHANLGGFGDLLQRNPTIAANRGQTKDAFFLFHLPASPSVSPERRQHWAKVLLVVYKVTI